MLKSRYEEEIETLLCRVIDMVKCDVSAEKIQEIRRQVRGHEKCIVVNTLFIFAAEYGLNDAVNYLLNMVINSSECKCVLRYGLAAAATGNHSQTVALVFDNTPDTHISWLSIKCVLEEMNMRNARVEVVAILLDKYLTLVSEPRDVYFRNEMLSCTMQACVVTGNVEVVGYLISTHHATVPAEHVLFAVMKKDWAMVDCLLGGKPNISLSKCRWDLLNCETFSQLFMRAPLIAWPHSPKGWKAANVHKIPEWRRQYRLRAEIESLVCVCRALESVRDARSASAAIVDTAIAVEDAGIADAVIAVADTAIADAVIAVEDAGIADAAITVADTAIADAAITVAGHDNDIQEDVSIITQCLDTHFALIVLREMVLRQRQLDLQESYERVPGLGC